MDKVCNFLVENSAWDSTFFGCKVAKTRLNQGLLPKEQEEFLQALKKYDFAIITNANNNPINNEFLGKCTKAFLTDICAEMEKDVKNIKCTNNKVSAPCSNIQFTQVYLDIVNDNMAYSKFFNDSSIKDSKAREIYTMWVKNSFNSTKKYFFDAKEGGIPKGFVLFSITNNVCYLELIIVKKGTKKIAKALMERLEEYCYENNIGKIKLATQWENYSAVCLYIKQGFKVSGTNTVYHYRG